MKQKILSLLLCLLCSTVWAQETTGWLLPKGSVEPWKAKYYYQTGVNFNSPDPAVDANGKNWYDSDFDDSSWNEISGAIGNKNWCTTSWNEANSSYWLRVEFDMKSVNYDAVHYFYAVHDDGIRVFLNGHEILTHNGVCGSDHKVTIESRYFVAERNILSVMVNNGSGDAYIDFGITSSDVNSESSNLTISQNGMIFRTINDSEVKLISVGDESEIDLSEPIIYNEKSYNLTSIAKSVFVEKSNIIKMTLPATLTNIESIPFSNCPDMVRLTILAETPPTLEKDLYSDYTDRYLFVPDVSVDAYKTADYWKNFADILPVSEYNSVVLKGDIFFIDGVRYIITSTEEKTAAVSNKGEDKTLNKTGNVIIADQIELADNVFTVTEVMPSSFEFWAIKKVTIGSDIKLGRAAFSNCKSLESVIFPAKMTKWEANIFTGCSALKSISIPEGIESILWETFWDCVNLEQVIFPSTLKTIQARAFIGCRSLDNLVFPDNLLSIERPEGNGNWGAFNSCTSLKNIDWGKGIQFIGMGAFMNCGFTKLENLPLNIRTIERHAFSNCKNLSSVKIPNSITSLDVCFEGCTNLTTVDLPTTLTTLGGTFNGCISLKQIDLKNVQKIVGATFRGCTSLESITIPSTVTQLGGTINAGGGANIFEDCYSLTEIVIPETVNILFMHEMFKNCSNLKRVEINAKYIYELGASFYGNQKLEEVIFSSNSSMEKDLTQYYGDSDKYQEGTFYHCTALHTVNFPKEYWVVPKNAFAYCLAIKNINIPSSVTRLDASAFSCCYELESIDIPTSVKTIGEKCFFGDEKLAEVYFGNNAVLEELSNNCFQGCVALTDIDIPSKVLRVAKNCFMDCTSLEQISLPATLTSVGDECFLGCTSLKLMTCNAATPPICGTDAFKNTLYNTEGVLRVKSESLTQYKAADQWCDWYSIVSIDDTPVAVVFEIDDNTTFVNKKETLADRFSYSRVFKNTNWQSIVLPVSLDYADFNENFEIAKIYNIIVTQAVEGGDLGDATIQIVKLKEGESTVPNVPYLICAKTADTENAQVLSKENCMVYKSETQDVECSNTETRFIFTGTYSPISAEDLKDHYALTGGIWYHQTGSAGLKPMRAYMTIESKVGGYNPIAASHAPLRVSVIGGNEGQELAIETVYSNDAVSNSIIVDKQNIGLPAGQYMIRGKKVMVK